MNPNTQFERDLEQWLQAEAPASAPAGFHASVMDRARTLRQRPGWATTLPVRRLGRGRGMTLLAAAALLGGAVAAGSGILRLPSVVPPLPSPSAIAVATASPDATFPSPSESAASSASSIPVADPGGVWIPTGTMGTLRYGHDAVRLLDGRVLVVGGSDGQANLTSAELYDPATGSWSAAGSISKPLVTATLLSDGKVLVLVQHQDGGPRSAELYDPANGTWTATGPMDPSAEEAVEKFTVLRDGRVLLAGWAGAQVYDPASGTWTATGPMAPILGFADTLTVLRDGRVLLAGTADAQVYDPASGTWTATGKKNGDRTATFAAAVLLSDGKVLVAGGQGFRGGMDYYRLDSAEVYDPITGAWTAIANMPAKTQTRAAFLLPNGKALVLGSTYIPTSSVQSAVEVYDPATGIWTDLPVRPDVRYSAATLLSDGAVLVTGETDAEQPACTADLYDPHVASWTTASSMLRCGDGSSFTLLVDGTVVKIDGSSSELYVPAGVSLPPFSFPDPGPPVVPSPTPVPTPLPPADGPVPPNARSWTVMVDNRSSEPAALFVTGDGLELVGSATPNVVPAGTTEQVTFLFPANFDGWIDVNLRPGEEGGLLNADQIGIPGKILIREDGETGWLSP